MTCYSARHLPDVEWGYVVRVTPSRAARMRGPFKVWTGEGVTYCEDGWLILDQHGNPFAVDVEEFERKWRPASDVFVVNPADCVDHSGECEVCEPVHPRQSLGTSRALAGR